MNRMTRRRFLGNTARTTAAATAAVAGLGTAAVLDGRQKQAAPSDKIRVALIGSGGQGKADLGAFLKLPAVDCPAIADVDDKHMAEGVKMVADARGKNPDGYKDFRQILDRKDIDAVIVATPDHWHALATILACQAGKDVYVEKPLATTIAEGRAMVTAARKHKRVVDVGTQQRSAGHFKDAVAFVKGGKLGKIRMVRAWAYLDWKGDIGFPPDEPPPPELYYDMWLGPAPQRPYNRMRVHHNFRWIWDYSGGLQTDWGAHMVDVVMWAMGEEPRGAMAIGGKFGFPNDIRETPDTQQSIIEFPSFSLVWEHMIGCGIGPWQREHGCEFHGENGILVVDRGGWEVYAETDRFKQPERVFRMMPTPRQLVGGDFHLEHVKNFVECLKTRKIPTADVEIGHKSITAPHLGNIAVRLRRYVKWDPATENISGDAEAQALVSRQYRKPWVLPTA
ncbi:MAG: Gfo/Idh/MocA family oxidoreductase [Acidobacteriia bacterium]|nr:Gfo/Idh/MocA family oxidoreductase [Terriglobia bacterium]